MEIFPKSHGILADLSTDMFPSRLIGHTKGETKFGEPFSHCFGFVISGTLSVKSKDSLFSLGPNMYFSLPGPVEISGDAHCVVSQRIGYRGMPLLGGPLEESGRLCYIDNCMTSILISPARFGDPCFNLLTFPPQVEQSLHVHPSIRFGVVVSGEGHVVFGDGSKQALTVGSAFFIPPAFPHCFFSGKAGLRVVAYHPDSDFGPTDKFNPMLNRTYLS